MDECPGTRRHPSPAQTGDGTRAKGSQPLAVGAQCSYTLTRGCRPRRVLLGDRHDLTELSPSDRSPCNHKRQTCPLAEHTACFPSYGCVPACGPPGAEGLSRGSEHGPLLERISVVFRVPPNILPASKSQDLFFASLLERLHPQCPGAHTRAAPIPYVPFPPPDLLRAACPNSPVPSTRPQLPAVPPSSSGHDL